jgi:hypothetical protein
LRSRLLERYGGRSQLLGRSGDDAAAHRGRGRGTSRRP